MERFGVEARTSGYLKVWAMTAIIMLAAGLSSCGRDEKPEQKTAASGAARVPTGDASISGTITLDPALKDKPGKAPLLMIIASRSPEPKKPAVIVQRSADVTFPYQYKLTAEDTTLVGSRFEGNMYVSARIDPEGKVGPPGP